MSEIKRTIHTAGAHAAHICKWQIGDGKFCDWVLLVLFLWCVGALQHCLYRVIVWHVTERWRMCHGCVDWDVHDRGRDCSTLRQEVADCCKFMDEPRMINRGTQLGAFHMLVTSVWIGGEYDRAEMGSYGHHFMCRSRKHIFDSWWSVTSLWLDDEVFKNDAYPRVAWAGTFRKCKELFLFCADSDGPERWIIWCDNLTRITLRDHLKWLWRIDKYKEMSLESSVCYKRLTCWGHQLNHGRSPSSSWWSCTSSWRSRNTSFLRGLCTSLWNKTKQFLFFCGKWFILCWLYLALSKRNSETQVRRLEVDPIRIQPSSHALVTMTSCGHHLDGLTGLVTCICCISDLWEWGVSQEDLHRHCIAPLHFCLAWNDVADDD